MSCRFIRSLVVVQCLLLTPWAVAAQPLASQDGTAAPLQEDAGRPQPIPEGQIASSADVVAADLRRIETLLRPDQGVARIEARLVEREAAIVALLVDFDGIDRNQISARHLEDQRVPWFELREELEDWAERVAERFEALQLERERLRDERIQWEDTSETVDAEELASELLLRIRNTLARVGEVEARVRERRNEVGAIADRIASSREQVADAQVRFDDMADTMRSRLFDRERTVLWRALDGAESLPLADAVTQAGRDWQKALFAYFGLRRARILALLVLFGALLTGALQLRRQSLAWPVGDEAYEPARRLLARPFSLALAFTVVIAALVLPFPVWAVTDVLLVLSIVPMVRIGSLVLASDARRALHGVAMLTVLAHIGSLGPDGAMMKRAFFLLVSGLAFAGATRIALRGRESARDRDGWQRVGDAAASMAAIVFGLATVANVVGWVGLSRIVTQASLDSAFVALAWVISIAAIADLLPTVFEGPLGQALPSLRRNRVVVCRVLVRATAVLALLAWTRSSLVQFQIWEIVRTYATDIAASGFAIGGLTLSAGGILGAISTLVATWLIASLVRFGLREEVLPRFNVRRGAAQSLVTLANYVVYGVGIAMAAAATGLSGTQLTVVIGALSVGIGFGLQNIINNFVSGLILIFERPIKVGDTVQTVDHWGQVQRIGIRASIIRSFDGAEIVVPNGDLIARELINWTRSDEIRRLEVLVGVAYGTEPEAVLEILRRVAREHPRTLEDPAPKAQMIRFGESSLDFRVRCWARMEDWIDVVCDLHVAINKELKIAGITIPFPQRDLHVKGPVALQSGEEATSVEPAGEAE